MCSYKEEEGNESEKKEIYKLLRPTIKFSCILFVKLIVFFFVDVLAFVVLKVPFGIVRRLVWR